MKKSRFRRSLNPVIPIPSYQNSEIPVLVFPVFLVPLSGPNFRSQFLGFSPNLDSEKCRSSPTLVNSTFQLINIPPLHTERMFNVHTFANALNNSSAAAAAAAAAPQFCPGAAVAAAAAAAGPSNPPVAYGTAAAAGNFGSFKCCVCGVFIISIYLHV